jgi:hypothetical protein
MGDGFQQPHLYPVPRIPEGVKRQHPAYTALFEAYAQTARSPSRALALVREFWDDDSYDAPLPERKLVAKWAKEDGWNEAIDEWALSSRPEMREIVNIAILTSAPNAVKQLNRVINEEIDDPKMANVVSNAANRLLMLAAAGILGTRYGDLPFDNAAQERAIKAIQSMTPQQVLELRRQALKEEGDDHEGQ